MRVWGLHIFAFTVGIEVLATKYSRTYVTYEFKSYEYDTTGIRTVDHSILKPTVLPLGYHMNNLNNEF